MKQFTEQLIKFNSLFLVFIIISFTSFFLLGCKNEKSRVYFYSSYLKSISINNIYYEKGYPKPDKGNWCDWGPAELDKSYILIDPNNNAVNIYNNNRVEKFKIIETHSQDASYFAFSYIIITKNERGEECTFLIGNNDISIVIQVMLPYKPARLYMVTSIDTEEFMRKLKSKFYSIPR